MVLATKVQDNVRTTCALDTKQEIHHSTFDSHMSRTTRDTSKFLPPHSVKS
jgi:hypothetical protein